MEPNDKKVHSVAFTFAVFFTVVILGGAIVYAVLLGLVSLLIHYPLAAGFLLCVALAIFIASDLARKHRKMNNDDDATPA